MDVRSRPTTPTKIGSCKFDLSRSHTSASATVCFPPLALVLAPSPCSALCVLPVLLGRGCVETPISSFLGEQFPQEPVHGSPRGNELSQLRVRENVVLGLNVLVRVFTQPLPIADVHPLLAKLVAAVGRKASLTVPWLRRSQGKAEALRPGSSGRKESCRSGGLRRWPCSRTLHRA